MAHDARKKVLLILNPKAGRKRAGRAADSLTRLFRQNGYRVETYVTGKPGDATDFAGRFATGSDLAVCCGGDGTLHEVINGILHAGAQLPVGYIPAGTTNDVAHTLHISGGICKAAETILHGRPAPQDAGTFNGTRFFSYVACFGAFTSISYSTPQWMKNFFGYAAYLFQIPLHLQDLHPYELELTTDDGRHEEGRFLFGSVSNAHSLSGIFKFKRTDVCIDDGQFELMLIRRPENPLAFFKIAYNLIARKTDGHFVVFRHVRSAKFRFKRETSWTLDGEFAGEVRSAEIRNLHNALYVIHSAR